ncbi:MAG: hypothetical protein QME48_06580 [bacterium]|uniref:Uncharacterized protein n=2 Tax=Bacteria candidate phyla TaxID=1783234 RepID=A0A101I4E3_UNCT6|nr:MAG: hypothetical protein XD76_0106 [candidate division TA06 bacterium 32_111]KUK88078.1 MAG: hypothetical protein XE03_0084 [candidate division TA06 bacterium 34_109]MDI6700879.1 hypothetical protein [bacterium]HAF07008.1 hypothetical protein [candidate division WOR-3 bacterium]HCP16922.1 hypothetical protein [candidate division WOR-3 bacterium]
MIKILENYFLKRKVKKMETSWKRQINTSSIFNDVKNVVVLLNDDLKEIEDFLSFDRSLKNRLDNPNVLYFTSSYFTLYKDLFKDNFEEIKSPKPLKFEELDQINGFLKRVKQIDLYFDLSSYENLKRKLFIRTFKPSVSITFFEDELEEDFNILFKSSDRRMLKILKLLNFEIVSENFSSFLKDRIKQLNITVSPVVLIGKSSKVIKEKKRMEKEGRRFLYIKNLKEELNIVNLYHILNTKEIFFDEELFPDVNFLKKFKV